MDVSVYVGMYGCTYIDALLFQLPDGTKTGQNLAYWSNPSTPVGKLVQLWMDEKKDYDLKSGACAGGKVCGHYTQMVWNKSTKVGCGATQCPGMGLYLVCDYTPAGNFIGEAPERPARSGKNRRFSPN